MRSVEAAGFNGNNLLDSVADTSNDINHARSIMRYAIPFTTPLGERWVMSLGAYFDESGTNPDDPALIIAGFISDEERWGVFSEKWARAMQEWEIPFWHMADFEARREQFADWPRDQRPRDRLEYLLSLITEYALVAIHVALPKALFRDYMAPDQPKPESRMYQLTTTALLVEIIILRQQLGLQGPMAFVFEQGARGSGEVKVAYDSLSADTARHFDFASLTFARKEMFEPLQAADILAYEWFRQWPKAHGNDTRDIRYPLFRINERIAHRRGGHIARENLDEMFAILGDQL